MIRRLLRLSSPAVFVTAVLRGSPSQRIAVTIGLVMVAVGGVVTVLHVVEQWYWVAVILVGWLVCEVSAREFGRPSRKRK